LCAILRVQITETFYLDITENKCIKF